MARDTTCDVSMSLRSHWVGIRNQRTKHIWLVLVCELRRLGIPWADARISSAEFDPALGDCSHPAVDMRSDCEGMHRAGWGMYIDPSNPSLGYNGFALIARDATFEYGSCAIASDAGYTYQ